MEKKYKDESWLREQYHEKGLSYRDIAKKVNVNFSTIRHWIKKFDIPTREYHKNGKYKDESWLREQYHEKGLSQREIADKCNVDRTTIDYWMKKIGISTRLTCRERNLSQYTNRGYEFFRVQCGEKQLRLNTHQLVAIMDGADPHKVFSDGDYHIHHKNEIKWDNRQSNLELMTASEHMSHHRGGESI